MLVVFVTRSTSGVGRRMESMLARLQLQDRRVRVFRVDADDRPELCDRLGVREVPSIVMLKDRKPVAWLPGRSTFGDIGRALATHGQSDTPRSPS